MLKAKAAHEAMAGNDLYRRIGVFLADHHLSPDPGHFAFAWHVLRDPDGPIGRAVASLTDGGVRLSRESIEQLGGQVSTGAAPLSSDADDQPESSVALVAQTQMQVESFAAVVRAMHDETRGFGRDLAASAEAIRRTGEALGIEDIVQMTGVMLRRVRDTERRLQEATDEADQLRAKLEEAQGSARRDPLTDLANRRALEEAYAAATPGRPLCFAVCDVDRFKQVNDRFGHGVGDRVLKAIGQTLVAGCEGHLVARYGGEEFAVLFTGIGIADARRMLDATPEAVAAPRLRLRESDTPLGSITFSAGVGGVGEGERFETVFARIDRALYRAKAEGRDRVVLASRPRG